MHGVSGNASEGLNTNQTAKIIELLNGSVRHGLLKQFLHFRQHPHLEPQPRQYRDDGQRECRIEC